MRDVDLHDEFDSIGRTIAWHDADPARRVGDDEANAKGDRLIAGYQRGLDAAKREFGRQQR